MNTRLRFAIADNVAWCTLIGSELNDVPSLARFGGVIFSRKMPAYFPNFISTESTASVQNQCALVQALRTLKLPVGFGIKDSYANLDLSAHGFRCAMEGRWIGLDNERGAVRQLPPAVSVLWPETRHGVEAWIQASGFCAIDIARYFASPRAVRTVAFLAVLQGQSVRAGAIVSATQWSAGISNVFSLDPNLPVWPLITTAIRHRFGDALLVGWESGDALDAARDAGFESLHPMRVWIDEQDAQ
jgi:hypothetical protein